MERLEPLPLRAMAFSQVQLSNVLAKQRHSDESMHVLSKAVNFYLDRARSGIAQRDASRDGLLGVNPATEITQPPLGDLLTDDVQQCLSLMQKMVDICDHKGGSLQALEQVSD